VGSYASDDTYITVAEVTVAVADQYRGTTKKTVSFSASPPLQEEHRSSIKPFEALLQTRVAVYAGAATFLRARWPPVSGIARAHRGRRDLRIHPAICPGILWAKGFK